MKELPEHIKNYFAKIDDDTKKIYELAKLARSKGYDPVDTPEIQLAANMAERVVGLVSIIAPQIINSGIVERIQELEQKYSVLDWRVAFKIALEVAQQKYCSFSSKLEAMEVGIRIGFAYVTNGVVSSPLEGFVNLELIPRNDGKGEYFRINYAGPVRNAGGTAAAVSVLIADYVRKQMGYAPYDPTEDEIKRCYTEISNYHERVTNLQYFPSEQEIDFLLRNMPVEVSGDPTEKIEVSNYKNLPRIPTNKIRSGYCLIYSSCLPLKAPKLWKQLSKWGSEFGMEQWDFLEEFIEIQHKAKASSKISNKTQDSTNNKISPVYTYIADLVAGRPVFSHPLRPGGFRLRYGRCRLSGLSGQSLHPATMIVCNNFIATGSQLKVERPGKAAAYTVCEQIQGPIVRLDDGEVLQLTTEEQARNLLNRINKILFLGDVLICYGDFLDRAHPLVPPGYCEEWWLLELKQTKASIPEQLLNNPITYDISFSEAVNYSKKYSVPLHPKFLFYYSLASTEQLIKLYDKTINAIIKDNSLEYDLDVKEILEIIGCPHKIINNKVFVYGDNAKALKTCFSLPKPLVSNSWDEFMNTVSPVIIRDKAGVFIGARLGRPEKAKMRKLTGSPHSLFPVGQQGGRLRSFNEALETGMITSSFELFYCDNCKKEVVLSVCPVCELKAKKKFVAPNNQLVDEYSEGCVSYKQITINPKEYLDFCLRRMKTSIYPDLIKSVRGTSNQEHATEHLMKGLLRARHEINVNKDGTVRYDASEVPITHFRCKEIGITPEIARKLGYVSDIHGNEIVSDDQLIELFPQDVILPACDESPDEKSDDVFFRVSKFIDELLVYLYGLKPYYNAKSPIDLVGHYVIALAPHTSTGTLGRIIGFSKTQGLFYHPYLHCATRRDCDGDEGGVFLLLDALLNFSRKFLPSTRGGTMDAPLVLSTTLEPSEVDDMVFNMDRVTQYPLEFYNACLEYKMPWEVKIPIIKDFLGTPKQFYGIAFTHDTPDMNAGNRCSAYKILPSMQDKLESQMDLAEKISAVDEKDVARLVIEKHFIRDLKGNLRKFSMQVFRCVKCNEKYRRPPLVGNCKCGGRIIFTISEGSVVKYLSPAESLVKAYDLDTYLAQSLELTRRRVEEVFGKDPEKQLGLGEWF